MVLSKRRLSPYFLFALLLILAWTSFRVVAVFLDFVLVALFLSYLTYPGFLRVQALVRRPQVASFFMVLLVAILVVVPLGFLLVGLVNELRDILLNLNVDELRAALDRFSLQLDERLGGSGEPGDGSEPGLLDTVVPSVSSMASGLVTKIIQVLAEGILGVFVLLYVMYYTYTDGIRFVGFLKELLPMQEAHREKLFHEVQLVTRAVMYGSVLTALIQAILGGIGFAVFGIPNVIFWSFVMFILALLPLIGPPMVWGPWGAYLVLTGETFRGVGLLIYSAILVSTMDNILRPKLIGSRAQVHPVLILLGVLGGIAHFGFSGFILGPLVLSIFVTILDVYRKEFALKMDEEAEPYRMGSFPP